MKLRKFEDYLHEKLRDPEYAAIYVQTSLEDGGIEELLYALREVAIAQGETQKVAAESQRGQESPYQLLDDILHTLGMRLTVACEKMRRRSHSGLRRLHGTGYGFIRVGGIKTI